MSTDLSKLSDAEFDQELERRRLAKIEESKAKRRAYEELKADTVVSLCTIALDLNEQLKEFNTFAFNEMNALYSVLLDYSERHAKGKGNFTVEHEDLRIRYKKQGKQTFDERVVQAEAHILEFVGSYFDQNAEAKSVILKLLERKNGDFDIKMIQRLYAMENTFDHPSWKKGIELFKESYKYDYTKDYIEFQQKNEKGEWKTIQINFSKV